MNVICYLIVQGVKPKMGMDRENRREPGKLELRKNKPAVKADEIAVRLDMDIPDSLFFKPTLEVKAEIPESGEYGPVITAEVAQNISDIIKEQTGFSVSISATDN